MENTTTSSYTGRAISAAPARTGAADSSFVAESPRYFANDPNLRDAVHIRTSSSPMPAHLSNAIHIGGSGGQEINTIRTTGAGQSMAGYSPLTYSSTAAGTGVRAEYLGDRMTSAPPASGPVVIDSNMNLKDKVDVIERVNAGGSPVVEIGGAGVAGVPVAGAMAAAPMELPLIGGPSDPGAVLIPHPKVVGRWGFPGHPALGSSPNEMHGVAGGVEPGIVRGQGAAVSGGMGGRASFENPLVPGLAGAALGGLAGAGAAGAWNSLGGIGGGVVGVGHGGPQAPYAFNRYAEGFSNTTMFIRPLAAPSALGLMSFFAGAWIYGTWLAGWFGNDYSPCEFWPWLFIFGGLGQLVAAYKSFDARDNMTLVFHWAWGSFFIFISIWFFLTCFGYLPAGDFADPLGHQGAIGWVFLMLIFVQALVMLASVGRDLVWFLANLLILAVTILGFLGYIISAGALVKIGAYILIFASILTFYRAAAWLIAENHHVGWLPIFTSPLQAYNPIVKIPIGEPGIKKTH